LATIVVNENFTSFQVSLGNNQSINFRPKYIPISKGIVPFDIRIKQQKQSVTHSRSPTHHKITHNPIPKIAASTPLNKAE
jgi:hypothetical protein